MCGATGLGKTHLSLAIANEVIRRGYGVIYVSAPAIIAHYENRMRQRSETDELLDMATDCDLLIIDDLGTEFISQFSVSHIYNLINSRLLSGKPVIINTNFTMRELEKTYSNRLVSRLNGEAEKLNFFGRDIRIMKKRSN
jgi:DNA replication protein DnaC